MKTLRRHRTLVGIINLVAILSYSTLGYADTLYKSNSGNALDAATTVGFNTITNYAEGSAFTSGDSIVFNNLINAARTIRVSTTNSTNLSISGLTIGSLFNGTLLNPGGAITLSNSDNQSQTITLGSGGFDLSRAAQNLTLANATGGTLTTVIGANQTWLMRTGRTLSLAAVPVTMTNNVTIEGAGTVAIGNGTTGNQISGAGNLTINGAQSGGAAVVTLSGNNSAWTGAVTLGNAANHLRLGGTLNIDQAAASQNKLADAQTLTINNATVNLLGTGAGTETVAGVALGRGLNSITRSAGTGVLQANTITFGAGAGLNVGNIGTVAGSSHLTTDNLNTNGIFGGRAVAINGTTDTNWVKNATGAADGAVIAASGTDYTTNNALDTWTTATQNILMTATGTASTASRTINSLKIAHATATTAVTADVGAFTLTINDGFNGGGIIRNQNGATTIGGATVGVGSLTAGGVDDSINDTLYIWNSQNTLNIVNVIKDNNTGGGATDTLHLFSGGAGTTTVHANNTYTGGTTIAAGTVAIGANNATSNDADLGSGDIINHGSLILSKQTTASLAQQTIANNITGTGAFTINRGTATLSGVNDYSGATNVSASTTLRAGSATGISANSRMILNAATAILDLNTFDVSVAALRGDQTTASVSLGANTLTLSGSDLANSSTAETLTFGGAQNYQGAITGTGNLIKNGGYLQVFTAGGALSYTGTTTVNAGTLQFNKGSATTGLTVSGSGLVIANAANITGATAAVNLSGTTSTLQINNGFNQSVGSLTGVANSRLAIARGATSTNFTSTDSGGAPVTFAGVIQETGAGVNGASFTKAGTNMLILTGGNNYTGATTINDGTLQVGLANAVQVIPDRSSVVFADVATAILDLNGNNETVGSLSGGGAVGGNILLGAGRLTTGLDATSSSYAGIISGTGGINKVGNGTLTLGGNSLFTGAVNVIGGGLTLAAASPNTLASGINVNLIGKGATLTVNSNQTLGAFTSGKNSVLSLGTGATLSSGGALVTVVSPAATAAIGVTTATFATAHGLSEGMQLTGTNVLPGTFVRRVINSTSIELSQAPTVAISTALTGTATNIIASQFTGAGGYTKEGTGTVWLSPSSPYAEYTNTGATTVNAGTLLIGGEGSANNVLSRNSALVVNTGGTVNFFGPNVNLRQYQEVGSLAGTGGTINLRPNNVGSATLVVGRDGSTTTWGGIFVGDTTDAAVMKTGAGTLTLTGVSTSDNIYRVEQGALTISGTGRLDDASLLVLSNTTGAIINYSIGANTDAVRGLVGGGRVAGFQPYTIGGVPFSSNFGGNSTNQLGGEVNVATTSVLQVSSNDTPRVFGGILSGAGTFRKSGTGLMDLWGANTIDNVLVDNGILRLGVYGTSTGLGAISTSGQGSLSDTTLLTVNGGTFDLNSATETIGRLAGSGGTVALINGALTLANQNTVSTGTAFSGNLNSVLNLNASAASTLTLTGNSSGFGGTINIGTNAALILNRTGGAINSTGIPAARINLNGTGTQLTVTLADTIGSLAGSGNAVLTQALTIREGRSGTVSAAGYSGVMSGAGALILSNYGGLTISGNNTNAGGTTLSNGSRLVLNYGGGNNVLSAGVLTLNGANITLASSATTAAILESAASTTLGAGSSSIDTIGAFAATAATSQGLGLSGLGLGAITRSLGATLNVSTNAASTSTANVNGILGGYAVFENSTWAVANGATTAISGLNTFNADTFVAAQHTDITVAGTNAGGTADTLRFSGANATDITGATMLTSGGILVRSTVGANTTTISGALVGSGANELIIHQRNALGDLVLSNVAGTNTNITTSGGGKTIITNSIAGTGVTNNGNGYLQLGSGGTTGAVGSGVILNNGTIGVNRSNAQSFGAIISGTGNFEQLGSGTTTLAAANTFSGRVTVRNGTLEVTNNTGLGTAATAATNRWANLTSVNAGGTLSFTGGVTAVSEVLNLDGGTVNIATTAASTYSAPVFLNSSSTITLGAGAAVTHILSGQILSTPGSNLTINGVATGSTLAFTNPTNRINGNLTIGSNANVMVGNNTAGTLGVTGSITNNGTLTFNSNDATQFLYNNISGPGDIRVARSSVYLAGDLSGSTGKLVIPGNDLTVQVFLGDHDFVSGAPGFSSIEVNGATANANADRGVRFSQANNLLTLGANIVLAPLANTNANRLTYFTKNNVGTLDLTGKIAGEYAATSIDDRSYLETNSGSLLRIVTNAASNNFMMGLTAGVPDPAKAYGGQIAIQGDGSQGRINTNWSYFELTGDANQTISANITGGGNTDQGGIFIYNGSGTLTLSPGTTATSAADGNTLFNSRNQINRGTVIFNGGAGGGAWRNDGLISVGSGATLQVNAAETTNIAVMKNGTLTLNANYTQNGNASFFSVGQITGTGSLTLNGNVTNRLYNANNTFSGGLTFTRNQTQFVDAGSLGSGAITIASGSSTEAETQLLQYVGLTQTVETVNNAINITGTDAARQKGVASYGVGQLVIAGTVSVASPNFFNLRGGATGTYATQAPFATWTSGAPTVSGQITGTGGLLKEDAGSWQLSNATNNFTGNVDHRNGRLIADSVGVFNASAAKTYLLGSGGSTPQLEFSSAFSGGTLPSTFEMNLNGTTGTIRILNLGSGALTIADPTWAASGAGSKTLAIGRFDDVTGYTNVISGAIVNNSATNVTALTKDGLSTWRLDGVNTFTGAVNITEGVLQLNNASGTTLADAVDVNVNNSFGRGATLQLLTNETIDHLGGGIGSSVVLGANTLTIGSNNGAATFNGVISGTGGIIKTGTGAMGFGGQSQFLPDLGQNTYTGVTRINGGRIDSATFTNGLAAGAFGQSSNAAGNLILAGTIADSGIRFIGTHAQTTDRLFTLGPVGALSSPTAIWADGTFITGVKNSNLTFGNTGAIAFTGAGARTLTLRGSTPIDNTFRPLIGDNAAEVTSLQKVEQSVWGIDNANTYTGTTTINGGTLAITNNLALGSTTGGTTITQPADNTRSFLDLRGVTVTGEALTYSGGANNNSSGFGASTGTNLWTGTLAVNQAAIVPVFSGASLEFSGVVSGNNTINKLGAGTLILSNNNTNSAAFLARGGVVELNYTTNNGSKLADAAGLTLGATAGGLAVQGTGAYNGSSNAMHTEGTTIRLVGDHSGGQEIVSATTLDAGNSAVIRPSGTTVLRMNAITRGIGGTIDFGAASIANTDTNSTNGILGGWATVAKTDWAFSIGTGAADTAITALASYTADTWATANNVNVTTSTSQSGAVNSLRFNTAAANTITLTAAGTVNTGGILVTPNVGANASVITGSTLTAGNANDGDFDLIIHQYNTAPLVIDSSVINNGANNVGLTVSGSGPVVLTNDSNFRAGQTTINTGSILRVGNAAGAYGLTAVSTGTLGGNATISTQVTGAMTNNGSLIFDGAGADVSLNGAINGNGTIELAATNTRTIILNNFNNNYYGDTFINGGILAYGQGTVNTGNNTGLNTPGLGSNIGRTVIGADGRLELRVLQATNPQNATPGVGAAGEYISVSEGGEIGIPNTVVNGNYVTQPNINLSHRIDLNNTTTAGATFTVTGNNNLQLGAIIKGSTGFTKTGNGILTLSGTNWADGTPTLSGEIIVAGGLLYGANNGRSFGAGGVGNEITVQAGAGFDLRDNDFNFGDDPTANRKIIQIAGTGVNNTGALRNTSGTGTATTVTLTANASIGGNSRIEFAAYDTNINPGVTMTYPVLNGGTKDLTKVGINDLVLIETTINSLGKLIVAEGELRSETRVQFPFATNVGNAYPLGNPAGTATPLANYPHTILSAAQIPNGIDLVYGGQTPDPVNTLLQNAIVGARLDLFRQHGAHHTANITSFGSTSSVGGSYLELNSDTLPKVYTFWDGTINLTGLTNGSNSFLNIEAGGAGTNVNNTIAGTLSPDGDQVVNPTSMLIVQGAITGTGGVSKIGSRELRLTGANTFSGDFVVLRQANNGQPIDPAQNESYANGWGVSLYGQGTLAGTSNVVLERRGMLRVINHNSFDGTNVNGAGTTNIGANLTNRINDSAVIKLRDGMLIFDSGNNNVTETLGTVRPESGDAFIVGNLQDGSNKNTTLTINAFARQPGSTLTFTSWDSTATFGTTAPVGDDSFRIATVGTGLTMNGAGGATSDAIATGVLGGLAVLPISDQYAWANGTASTQERNMIFYSSRNFMTLDGGYLRPLDDSEYYTNTANMAGAVGQNLNLTLPNTSVLSDLTVNSLRFGNLDDNLNDSSGAYLIPGTRMVGWQQYSNALTIDDGKSLTVSSGMVLFANMGQGLNQDTQAYINGGTLDFGSNEGIITNVSGWYRTSDGAIASSAAFIRSTITGTVAPGSVGITKSGISDVFFDGLNTYTGLTKVANGVLNLRNNMALGAGGTGNGVVIEGSGQLYHRLGVNIGQNTAYQVDASLVNNGLNLRASREDILVGGLSFDNQNFARSVDSVNRHYGNITLDLVDSAGHTGFSNRFQPRLFLDANTTFILDGSIGGGNTAVSQDTYYNDARGWSLDGSAGWLVLQGSVGDKLDGSGNAISVSGPVTNKPSGTIVSAVTGVATTASTSVTVANTLGLWVNMPITGSGIPAGTTVTHINPWTNTLTLSQASTIGAGTTISTPSLVNENEVLRTWIGGSDQLNVEAAQQWKALGRIELMRGFLRYTGDAGTDFYDANTLGLINGSEAGSTQIGFQIGGGIMKTDPGDGSMTNFLLTKAGQSLGVNNFTITTNANNNQGAVMIGGENESGTVRFGPSNANISSTIALGRNVAIFANAGGTLENYSRFTGGSISKTGRGSVILYGNNLANFGLINNAALARSTVGNIQTVGGELVFDYTLANNSRTADTSTLNLNGGSLRLVGNATANSTQTFANANDNAINFRIGGSELVVSSVTSRTTTLNMGRLASATDGAVVTRNTGSTVNFVEHGNGGTSVITLAAKTGIVTNASIPWSTYGDAPRRAIEFTMVDTDGANVNAFGRALDEFNNDVATWATSQDVSENGGSGFRNALGANLTLNSLRFDANADSTVSLGANTLTVSGTTFGGFVGGGILVSSNVGTANKTITGGVLTTANTGELIFHHYSNGTLNIGSQIGATGAAPGRVIVTGPSVTGAAQLAAWSSSTTGQVVLTGANETAATETRWLLNGSTLSIDAENRLGKVAFAAATADAVYLNGGALRWTGAGYTALDINRGFTIGGNGGVIDVVDGNANLQISSDIVSENWLSNVQTAAANAIVGGDLIKMGAGTLTLTGGTDANQVGFTGMLDVREGTLRINGNNAATSGTQTISILGDNRTNILDGTIFRQNTNFEVALGSSGGGITWNIEENLRFEGNNTIRMGIPGATNRTLGLNGVIDLAGDVTVDVVPGLTARFNLGNGGYMTGSGDITKIGEGVLELRENNVLWSGGMNVYQGLLRLASQGLPGGVGTQNIKLGSETHQGIAQFELYQETGHVGTRVDVFQDVDVTYNPLQTKRLALRLESGAGGEGWVHGDITMSDNLGLHIIQSGRYQAGTYGNLVINGSFKDDVINNRSGNLVVHVDDENSGTANNQQLGEGTGYVVLRGNNSNWTGDLEIGLNQSFDQDEMSVVRLENANALTGANDVLMRGSSALQIAGNNVTIGTLVTNNAALAGTSTAGTANDGTGTFTGTIGSSAFIENASTTAANITITQTTPAVVEALWDAHFRDGQLPSHVLDDSQKIGAALSVTKAGNGWATMSVDNTYTGSTTVTAGILQVGRNGVGDTGTKTTQPLGAAQFTSNAGTTVAGTGSIQGLTVINGNLRPGDEAGGSMGTLTINGNATLGSTANTFLQVQRSTYTAFNALGYGDANYASWIGGLTSDPTYSHMLNDPVTTSQHDRLTINGTLTAGGKITLLNNGYNPAHGDVFKLIDWTTLSGTFSVGGTLLNTGLFRTGAETGLDLDLFELGSGFRWDVSLFNTQGIVVVVVPEPGRALLLLLGLMALFFRRRRQN